MVSPTGSGRDTGLTPIKGRVRKGHAAYILERRLLNPRMRERWPTLTIADGPQRRHGARRWRADPARHPCHRVGQERERVERAHVARAKPGLEVPAALIRAVEVAFEPDQDRGEVAIDADKIPVFVPATHQDLDGPQGQRQRHALLRRAEATLACSGSPSPETSAASKPLGAISWPACVSGSLKRPAAA